MNKDMRGIEDRNTEQHQEGNSANTEPPTFIFHYTSLQRGRGEATDFINII